MKIGFDVISDLNLLPDEQFSWEGKATSLYCIIAGNISNDLRTIHQTLLHLSHFYQGVFYTAGTLEYEGVTTISTRTDELLQLSKTIRNVAYLHNHVVIIDGVAIVGINGWYDTNFNYTLLNPSAIETERYEDIGYLSSTLEKLQLHLDVKKIIIVSHSPPGPELYFGQGPEKIETVPPLQIALVKDLETKITHWVYGKYDKTVDTVINNINYVNNSYFKRNPYWAKRIES